MDHELYGRLCDLLYNGHGVTPGKPYGAGVDSADAVFSPLTDFDSEKESWDCLQAFDDFTASEVSDTDELSTEVCISTFKYIMQAHTASGYPKLFFARARFLWHC